MKQRVILASAILLTSVPAWLVSSRSIKALASADTIMGIGCGISIGILLLAIIALKRKPKKVC